MLKQNLLAFATFTLMTAPAYAQDSRLEGPVKTELSTTFGLSYTDAVTLNDGGSTLVLEDVKTLDFGYQAERELARRDNLTLSGALSTQARFGEGNVSQLNGVSQSGTADFRRLGAYGDVIARLENEDGWTPFVSTGTGLVYDRVEIDEQKFQDLSPVGRVRAGIEKEVGDGVTLGMSVGKSYKLD